MANVREKPQHFFSSKSQIDLYTFLAITNPPTYHVGICVCTAIKPENKTRFLQLQILVWCFVSVKRFTRAAAARRPHKILDIPQMARL